MSLSHKTNGRAISVFPYLDDWLIRDMIRSQLLPQTIYCFQRVQSLGFISNLKKSDLISTQNITFIGMEFLTQQNLVRVLADRIEALILTIKSVLSHNQVSAWTLLSFLGKLSAAADFVLLGRLYLRPLQNCLLSVWRPHILPLDHQITVSNMIRFHLNWLMNINCYALGISIHSPDTNEFLFTDASHYECGAHLEQMRPSFHSRWPEDQSQFHINTLEMMLIRFALKKAIKNVFTILASWSLPTIRQLSPISTNKVERILPICVWRFGRSSIGAWNTMSWSEFVISQENSICVRPPFEVGQNYRNSMGIGSNDWEFHIPNAQLFQRGPVCDAIQSQTPIVCIYISSQALAIDAFTVN